MGIVQDIKELHDRYERGELTKAEYSAAKAAALEGHSKRISVRGPEYRESNRAVRVLTVQAFKCPKCGHKVSYLKALNSYQWEGKKPVCPICGTALNVWKTAPVGERPRKQK